MGRIWPLGHNLPTHVLDAIKRCLKAKQCMKLQQIAYNAKYFSQKLQFKEFKIFLYIPVA